MSSADTMNCTKEERMEEMRHEMQLKKAERVATSIRLFLAFHFGLGAASQTNSHYGK